MSQTTFEPVDAYPGIATLTDEERRTLLTDTQRIIVIQHLGRQSGSTDLEELATAVGAREDALDAESKMNRIKTSLHHYHLPMMDEMGLLDYEPTTHRVSV